MTHFVIQTDGQDGVLFVDGEQPELFGRLVAVDVRRDPQFGRVSDLANPELSELSARSIRSNTVVEVTLRLPMGPNDTLTVMRGSRLDDVYGPTVDGES